VPSRGPRRERTSLVTFKGASPAALERKDWSFELATVAQFYSTKLVVSYSRNPGEAMFYAASRAVSSSQGAAASLCDVNVRVSLLQTENWRSHPDGSFRSDLFTHERSFPLSYPRCTSGDLISITRSSSCQYSKKLGKNIAGNIPRQIGPDIRLHRPGNVRERKSHERAAASLCQHRFSK